jgi:alanine or glycine:cation symporter, AGCS family
MRNLRSIVLVLILCGLPTTHVFADSSFEEEINQTIRHSIGPYLDIISDAIFFPVPLGNGHEMPFVIIWLLVGAGVFTVYMGFINFKGFKHAIDVARGRYDDPSDPGEVTHFQALTAAQLA